MTRMHENEVSTSPELVRRLLKNQYPDWSDLPIDRVPSSGTDNALYRIGPDLVARLPRIDWAVSNIEQEAHWLPRFAPHLPLPIPEVVAVGEPIDEYPYPWSIYRWIEGEHPNESNISDSVTTAAELAQFVSALQTIDTTDAPRASEGAIRGVPLRSFDEKVRKGIAAMDDLIDTGLATDLWNAAVEAPDWDRDAVWFHGDLLRTNILVRDGRLAAVIDFGCMSTGDPAMDLLPAWSVFSGESRKAFRETLAADDAIWIRGMGLTLAQAVIYIPYYRESNPIGVASIQRQLDAVMSEFSAMS